MDRLQISLEFTQRLLSFFDVSPLFLDFIHSFGLRLDEGREGPVIHRCVTTSDGSSSDGLRTECCYNLKYPEKNGRPTGNPWSIRHSAVYLQHDPVRDMNIWIMVQPSKDFERQLMAMISSPRDTVNRGRAIHGAFFQSANRFWKDYIHSLEQKLTTIEHKALFSKVGVACSHDFDLTFRDFQLLKRLHMQLLRGNYLLDMSANAVELFKTRSTDSALDDHDHGMFRDYTEQVRAQKHALERLLHVSDHVSQTLSQILQYRNDEAVQKTSDLIRQHNKSIEELTRMSARDGEAIVELTRKSQQDSRVVKVLTVVASLYLPAAMVASVFNSNLVQTVTPSQEEESANFRISAQFWLFPVFTLALLLVTIVPVAVWMRLNTARGKAGGG
ncbi:hypothetical protein B0H63DRAFT_521456 [Podospora didyma]|uniref:CorA-like transporter domain-containing protein n=1 Tax=Podospora didyma TaxID=330526 RepID=A0AAE0NTI8_9PEZI|nr:hypothetical protein B0H63DRAFT_521456 [Podospora didyma]